MAIGLGTYAFFWQWHSSAERPLTLDEMLTSTAERGVEVFQICDYPPIEAYGDAELAALRRRAADLGLTLELGTRGVSRAHLRRHLRIAAALGVTLVRSMIDAGDHRPTFAEATWSLRQVVGAYESAGVTIALETYEQIPVAELVRLVAEIDSPALGICLDPGNSVAALDLPATTVEITAPYVKNVHVKDFCFSRRDGWVGFTLAGCPLGEGLLDYRRLVEVVRPDERGLNQIIEHWLPWQGDSATTIALEDAWNRHDVDYLRSFQP